jgi:hypothetical protein
MKSHTYGSRTAAMASDVQPQWIGSLTHVDESSEVDTAVGPHHPPKLTMNHTYYISSARGLHNGKPLASLPTSLTFQLLQRHCAYGLHEVDDSARTFSAQGSPLTRVCSRLICKCFSHHVHNQKRLDKNARALAVSLHARGTNIHIHPIALGEKISCGPNFLVLTIHMSSGFSPSIPP